MSYSVNFFIKKFSKIPKNKWCIGDFVKGNKCCALGHCGMNDYNRFQYTKMANRLEDIFYKYLGISVTNVNDGKIYNKYKHPKTRILKALNDIINKKYD